MDIKENYQNEMLDLIKQNTDFQEQEAVEEVENESVETENIEEKEETIKQLKIELSSLSITSISNLIGSKYASADGYLILDLEIEAMSPLIIKINC